MTTDHGPESGQALLEAAFSALLAAALAAGAWSALAAAWNRLACANAAFEVTRRALEGRNPGAWSGIRVVTAESGGFVEGRARCRGLVESVRLPLLERMR